MDERKKDLIIGALLHDVGKIVYRKEMSTNHSKAGYEYLKNNTAIKSVDILDQVRYHHASNLRSASVADDSLAYITYLADNIASATDRRQGDNSEQGYDPRIPLSSVFNILNGNDQNKKYKPAVLKEQINYPVDEATYSREFYSQIVENIQDCLREYESKVEYINSLLEILEANCSFIPSSTDKSQLADISLYDHLKLTAAAACCIYDYFGDECNYKSRVYNSDIYGEKIFLIYSMDISGIQDFIYTISSKFALKGLRARSFYLEILMEHFMDTLLERLNLSRANIIYSGGGHCYMLLPNTESTVRIADECEKELNKWFLKNFDIALYAAGGWAAASSDDLKNKNPGSYKKVFEAVSEQISEKKSNRYSAAEISKLNFGEKMTGTRECVICRRSGKLNENNMCEICSSLISISSDIMDKDFFCVVTESEKSESMYLPFGCMIVGANRDEVTELMQTPVFVRAYCKNGMYAGYNVSSKIWVGDYCNGRTFSDLANADNGINRLCVLRADVDNLGQAFVSGFENDKYGDKYVSLSRTAAFSRKLSMFFKYHINMILREGDCKVIDGVSERRAVIVYSGGDDVFVVGGWSDIIEFAVDLQNALAAYSQNTLTISAGIGIYPDKYPISAMAEETGELEENSKGRSAEDGTLLKNAVTLFENDLRFSWDELRDSVLNVKLKLLKDFFGYSEERGKAFLYNMLSYIRGIENDVINIARYAYLLSRLAPGKEASDEKKRNYSEFSQKMYKRIKNEKDRRELVAAMYLYAYSQREG